MSREGRLFLLGGVRATHQGCELVLAGAQPRLLLTYLALHPDRPVPGAELAEVLWGDHPARHWEGALRGVVAKVRAFLGELGAGAPSIDHDQVGYRLTQSEDWTVDVWQADRLLARAEEARALLRWEQALALAVEAAELLVAPLLIGVDAPWLTLWRSSLDRDRVRALGVVTAADLALGRLDDAIASARLAVHEDPFDEECRRALMAAYVAAGNRAAALRAYAELRRMLADELGAAPDGATEAMYLELLALDEHPVGPADARARTHDPFVGRAGVLAEIADAWDEARAGGHRVVLLHGEGGVGKTRLAIEAAHRADPVHALYGRAGAEQIVPLDMFVDALGARLGPGVASRGDAIADIVPAVLGRLAASPTVLVLDDLHCADADSLALLVRVIGRIGRARLLVVATYRDDVEPSIELQETVASLAAREGTRVLPVVGLGSAEVTELLCAHDVPEADQLAPVWRARTGGNGFYLTQVLLAAAESSRFDDALVPDAVTELVRARLATLSPGARDVLLIAAVIGGAFPRCLLERVARSGEPAPGAIDELIGQRLLIESGQVESGQVESGQVAARPHDLGFAHVIVRDAVYLQVPQSRRRRVHLQVNRAIDDLWPADADWAAVSASHLQLAESPGLGAQPSEALHL